MNVRLVKKTELTNDINEIIELLNKPQFDRNKANEIIIKHTLKNEKIAVLNSPLNPNTEKLENLTDDELQLYLRTISNKNLDPITELDGIGLTAKQAQEVKDKMSKASLEMKQNQGIYNLSKMDNTISMENKTLQGVDRNAWMDDLYAKEDKPYANIDTEAGIVRRQQEWIEFNEQMDADRIKSFDEPFGAFCDLRIQYKALTNDEIMNQYCFEENDNSKVLSGEETISQFLIGRANMNYLFNLTHQKFLNEEEILFAVRYMNKIMIKIESRRLFNNYNLIMLLTKYLSDEFSNEVREEISKFIITLS